MYIYICIHTAREKEREFTNRMQIRITTTHVTQLQLSEP